MKKPTKKLHLGFKEAQAKIAKKQGVSMKAAGAILASSARKASPAAVKKNPALLNVKRGKVKKYGDGGTSVYKGTKGITTKTKVSGSYGTPSNFTYDINHKGKKGSTSKTLDVNKVQHKGSKGVTSKTSSYDNGVTYVEHKGKLGTTAVRKDRNLGEKEVYYKSNTPGKKSFSKISKLRKGGKKR